MQNKEKFDEVLDNLISLFSEMVSENEAVDMYRVCTFLSFNLMASICFSERYAMLRFMSSYSRNSKDDYTLV